MIRSQIVRAGDTVRVVLVRPAAACVLTLLVVSAPAARAFVWQHQQRLYGADLDSDGASASASALDVDGTRLVAGKPRDTHAGLIDAGAAYVFERRPAAWVLEQPLLAPDAAAGDAFGFAVAVSGDTLAVGAPRATSQDSRTRAQSTSSNQRPDHRLGRALPR